MSRARPLARAVAILLACGVVAAAHWPVLAAQALSLDDEQFVTRNPLVTHPGWGSAGRFFAEVLEPSSVPGYSLPLTMTSLMLDWAAGGRPGNLAPFHRTNLALHLASVALIVLILERLSGSLIAALASGLLFGLHPLTVEPVAWITERKTLLAACFGFASILAYLEACRTSSRGAKLISLGAYLLALLSKPTVLTLPLLLIVLDRWPLRRFSARTLAEKWPWVLLALAFSFVSAFSLERTLAVPAGARADPGSWAWQIAWTIAFEVSKVVRPGTLACVYEPPDPYTLSNPLVVAGVIGVAASTVALVLLARRTPWPLAGWAFFVLALVPTFRPVNGAYVAAADKYLYFAAPGLLMVLAAGLAAAWARALGPGRAGLGMLVLALAALEARHTRATIGNWGDSLIHFRHLVAVAPRTPTLRDALGSRLFETGAWEEAMGEYRRAIALEPGYQPAHFNLGNALATAGRTEEAVAEFRVASQLAPSDGRAAFVLALALDRAGHGAQATAEARHALALAEAARDPALAAEARAFLEAPGRRR
jgi:tetratricopeptide (TPR) repeat protein